MHEAIMQAYLKALESADLTAILSLFSKDAKVHSPLYGERPAKAFFPELLQDSRTSRIEPLAFFGSSQANRGAVNFHYHWTLADGQAVTFDCVDLFDFDQRGKIKRLRIIYDTAQTRPALAQLRGSA